jgi:hypothetical protein
MGRPTRKFWRLLFRDYRSGGPSEGERVQWYQWFVGTLNAAGMYIMTLIPTPDPTAPDGNNGADFDFTGETLAETFGPPWGNTCDTKAPGAFPDLNTTTRNSPTSASLPARWTVGQLNVAGQLMPAPKNTYGTDDVAYNMCSIEAYRCARATIPSCSIYLTQTMKIHSPADQPDAWADFTPPQTHALSRVLTGRILPDVPGVRLNFNRFGIGDYTAQKDSVKMSIGVPTSLNNCSNSSISISPYLKNCQ